MTEQLRAVARSINERARDYFCPTMKIGATVMHPKGYPVKIISGQYLDPIYGRVSNFWTWQRVNDDGSLGEKESGYGW